MTKDPKKVLLVEDDASVRATTIEVLQLLGFCVVSAENAPEALTILESGLPIDLLFSDVVMPRGISGVELARRARAARPDLPILLASGHPRDAFGGDEVDREFAFLPKPYRLGELATKLRELLLADA